jgi:hypothetical protein
MLKEITIARDPLDPSSWERFEVEDICAFLLEQFSQFPDHAHIYHNEVSQVSDVTPKSPEDIEALQKLEGRFFVVVYSGYVALPYIFAVLLAAASYFLAPSAPALPLIPQAALRNSQTPSPNNELSDRTNRARVNGRIPDIFGTGRSTPDIIAAPYKIFENNREVEFAYMCIGRGEYEVSDIRDGETLCSNIPGVSIEVYEPYTSPNSGDAPSTLIGTAINRKITATRRSNSVNGQVLRPPNVFTLVGAHNISFVPPNVIRSTTDIDFTKGFVDGDTLTITSASLAAGGTIILTALGVGVLNPSLGFGGLGFFYNTTNPLLPVEFVAGATISIACVDTLNNFSGSGDGLTGTYTITGAAIGPVDETATGVYIVYVFLDDPDAHADTTGFNSWSTEWPIDVFIFTITGTNPSGSFNLDGDYTVISVTANEIVLDNPSSVSGDWLTLATGGTPYISPTLAANGEKWVGPFVLEDTELTTVYSNFVASNGLYMDNGTAQFAVSVSLQIELEPINLDGTSRGTAERFIFVMGGSAFNKETSAMTGVASPINFTGRCNVRARRASETNTSFTGQVIDEVRWRDCYSVAPVTKTDFGNITTIWAKTFATASALAVKERKLNCLATRKVPQRNSSTTFDDTLVASDDAADILCAVCRDHYIGNRSVSELDVQNIYDTADAVEAYFGHANARKFCYTFDSDNISFEETVSAIASALFCVAYRRGNVIKLSFEKATTDSTLLFNHRNKLPGSEKRSISFGFNGDYDGIEFTYQNPDDDSLISIFLPEGTPTTNQKKIESIGIRNHLQAYFLAWRAWNKLRYQNTTIEFDATQESDIAVLNDRVLVTDGTRPNVQDGEVKAVNTLELTLSQVVNLTVYASYVIFLQLSDGSVESIAITAGSAANKVVLAIAPTLPLVVDVEGFANTTYVIVGNTEQQQTAFLIAERTPQGNKTSTVRAVNYDARYYANDLDLINNVIDENGYGPAGGFTPGTGTGFPVTTIPINYSGVLVSVGLDNNDITSTDGLTWTLDSIANHEWTSVIYSAELDLFVAVGTNAAMSSTDGLTWTNRTITSSAWNDVVWSPELGIFLAVSTSTTASVVTSTNGTSWTIHTSALPSATNLRAVAWSPALGLFATARDDNDVVFTSTNGISWTAHTTTAFPSGSQMFGVIWVDDLSMFVAVGTGGAVHTSTDGVLWSTQIAPDGGWKAIAWSPTLELLVVVSTDGTVMTSPNATSWTLRTCPVQQWTDVIWSDSVERFIACSENGTNHIMTSEDGRTWTLRATPGTLQLESVVSAPDTAHRAILRKASSAVVNMVARTGTGGYTVCGWSKFMDGGGPIWTGLFNDSSTDIAIALDTTSTGLKLDVVTSTGNEIGLPDNRRWFFWAVVIKETAGNMYADTRWMYLNEDSFRSSHSEIGLLISNDPVSNLEVQIVQLNNSQISGNDSKSKMFSQVRQWNAALSASELLLEKASLTAVRTSNLFSSNRMNGVSDTSDASGNGHSISLSVPADFSTVSGPHNA